MKLRLLTFIALLPLLSGELCAQLQRSITLGDGQKIAITVPMGYSYKPDFDADRNARVHLENPVWQISITAIINASADPEVTTAEWQQNMLIQQMAEALPQSKETDYNFKPLAPKSGTGVYCVFTDATHKPGDALPPNEFLHMTGGIKAWSGGVLFFQIMSNSITSEEYREAFELFRESFIPSASGRRVATRE